MDKILVVNVNWVGDVIFSVPVFKALKKAYPRATVTCLAVPRVKEVLESCAFVDRIMVYDEEGRDSNPIAKLNLISRLRAEKFDAAFLLHRSLTRALLVFFAGIPQRVGYDAKGRGAFLTHKVKPLAGESHRSDHYLNVVESFGIKVEDRVCDLAVAADAQKEIEQILSKEGINREDFVAVINPGGNWDLKRWPKEKFAELMKRLVSDFRAKVVIPGAPKDAQLAEEISRLANVKPVILAGRTNLKQLAALFKRAQVVVSADSGPLHLASGVGAKVVALFGPTRPEVTGPRGPGRVTLLQKDVGCNREPCYNLACPDNICMRSISVDEVVNAVGQIRN